MSSYVDQTSGAVEHCALMSQQHPDLADDYYNKISTYCKQKLWHQLTLTILDLVDQPTRTLRITPEGTNSYLALYDKVVLSIDSKVNPLSLARIASSVASSLANYNAAEPSNPAISVQTKDVTAAKAVLENFLAKQNAQSAQNASGGNNSSGVGSSNAPVSANEKAMSGSSPAKIYVESKLALLTLTKEDPQPPIPSVKSVLTKNGALLKELMVTPTTAVASSSSATDKEKDDAAIVHSAHYEMAMKYYKIVGPPEAFYDQAMSYLNYATEADIPNAQELAVDLCLAAFTGKGVYNLGQVVTTPLLQVLKGTPEQWLVDMLVACSKGQVLDFQKLTQQHADDINKQPALVHRSAAVQEKLTLLALVNLVFEKSSNERTLSFQEISDRIHTPLDQVELVIMRAFSVHLIEGIMDQVGQTVTISWVMPRVLDTSQLADLATRFGTWAGQVSKAKDYMQEQTPTFA